jgi:hypothetical protein
MKVPGNYPQWAMGGRSGKGSNLAAISPTAKHGRSHVSSRKLTAMGRWKSVPGKVQISMQSHSILWNMEEHMSVPGNFPQMGRWKNIPGKVQISLHLTGPCRHGRLQVSSWKLPATGRWRNVPGKVQISMQSHSLPNMGIERQFLETSRNGAMEERSGKGWILAANLTP